MPREGKANVLSDTEFKRVLKIRAGEPPAERNTARLDLSGGRSVRVKEIGALSISDVLNAQGQLKEEINRLRRMTKGGRQRHVYLTTISL